MVRLDVGDALVLVEVPHQREGAWPRSALGLVGDVDTGLDAPEQVGGHWREKPWPARRSQTTSRTEIDPESRRMTTTAGRGARQRRAGHIGLEHPIRNVSIGLSTGPSNLLPYPWFGVGNRLGSGAS